jgi:hypothetical protein
MLVKADEVWGFASERVIRANGWPAGEVRAVSPRDIDMLPMRRIANFVDRRPQAVRPGRCSVKE